MNYRRTFALLAGWMLALCAAAQIPLTVGEAPPLPSDDGLLVYLPFDGGTDNLAPGGSAVEGTDVAFVDGACGQAALFNGVDDYLRLVQTLDLDDDYTFTAWVHPYSQTDEKVAFAVRDQCTSTYRGYAQAQVGFNQMAVDGWSSQVNVHMNCTGFSAGDRYRNTDLILPNNATSFVAVVVTNNDSEGRTVTLHANCGAYDTEMTIDFPTGDAFGTVPDYETTFGAKSSVPGRTATFDGWIDEVRVYERTLSDDELEALYRQCAHVDWEVTLVGECQAVAEVTVYNSQPGISYALHEGDGTPFGDAQDGNCETLVFTTPVFAEPTTAEIINTPLTDSGTANSGFELFDIIPPPSTPTGTSNTQEICDGEAVTWNGASYTTAGTFTFVSADGLCPQVDTLELTVTPYPELTLPETVTSCDSEVTVTAPTEVTWLDGSVGTSFLATETGWVSASLDALGCVSTDSTWVSFESVALLLGEDLSLCAGESAVLTGAGTGDLLWSDGSLGPELEVSTSGTYSAVLTVGDCSAADSVEVTVHPLPALDLPDQVESCEESALLSTAEAVLWMDGTTATTFEATTSGWVLASLTQNGCTTADSTWVELGAISLDLGNDTTLCWGQILVLEPAGEAELNWSDGSAGPTLEVTTSGVYAATLVNGNCTATDSIAVVALGTTPVLDAPASLCPDEIGTASVFPDQPSAVWTTGETGSSTSLNAPGTVGVTVSIDGCEWSDEATVASVDLPSNPLAPQYTLCLSNPELQVIADQPFTWPDGTASDTYSPNTSGTVEVTTDSPCGTLTFSTEVTLELCDCNVYVPNAFTPDRDGINEVFAPVVDCPLEDYHLQIFSRNGQQVFETFETTDVWNGGIDRAYVQHDVYVWRLEYRPQGTAEPLLLEGHVVVIR